MKTIKGIHLDDTDTCVTLPEDATAEDIISFIHNGDEVTVSAKENIPQWHKMSIMPIKVNEYVYKYGSAIGIATEDISEGMHVHIHNIRSTENRG